MMISWTKQKDYEEKTDFAITLNLMTNGNGDAFFIYIFTLAVTLREIAQRKKVKCVLLIT